MSEEYFSGKVTFDAKLEGDREDNHVDIWGKNIPGRRISQAEALRGAGLVCLRPSWEARGLGWKE